MFLLILNALVCLLRESRALLNNKFLGLDLYGQENSLEISSNEISFLLFLQFFLSPVFVSFKFLLSLRCS